MLLVGKLARLSALAPAETGRPTLAPLFYVTDLARNWRFLVDTGAQVSVVPPRVVADGTTVQPPDAPRLEAANGTEIKLHGVISTSVRFGTVDYPWTFMVADVSMPILGADFLAHHRLLVDMRRQLLQAEHGTTCAVGTRADIGSVGVRMCAAPTLADLFREFPRVTATSAQLLPVRHNVTHHIVTRGPPRVGHPRRLPPDRLRIARQEFDKLITSGSPFVAGAVASRALSRMKPFQCLGFATWDSTQRRAGKFPDVEPSPPNT